MVGEIEIPTTHGGHKTGEYIPGLAQLEAQECDAASLEPAARSDRRHGRRFLTYQADRDNVRRDAGDWHEGARTAAGSPPRLPPDERTCRDDQE